jgi:predicted type IV restriction endonuclease
VSGERNVPELRDAIKHSVERLERLRRQSRRLGEQNTKASLIEPVIDALGWDIRDPDEVHHEYRRRSTDNPVDYALLLRRTACLFIEAKGLGENLDEPRWANQIISYATVAGVEWVALTDGAEWRIYNSHALVPVEQKLLWTVRIDSDLETATAVLSLLSKDNMRQNQIAEMWRHSSVDRLVKAELTALSPPVAPHQISWPCSTGGCPS